MIDDEQAQKLRLALAGSGWNDVMRPAIENRGRQAVKALVLTRVERAAQYKGQDVDTDDEVLTAIIRDCEWMLGCWQNELNVWDYNRRRDELDRSDSNEGTAAANQQ